MRVLVATTLVGLACLVGGCAASGRGDDAQAVVQRFQTALHGRDGDAACAELSEDTSSKLEEQEGKPCEQAILGLELPTGEMSDSSVHVLSASVSLREGATLFLDEASDGWEISAAGCTPTAPGKPYDCELEN